MLYKRTRYFGHVFYCSLLAWALGCRELDPVSRVSEVVSRSVFADRGSFGESVGPRGILVADKAASCLTEKGK
jgi:hypothetical protein